MKKKYFYLFVILILTFTYANAQITSMAVIGSGTGESWPLDPHIDTFQMSSADGENWTISNLTLNDAPIKFRANNSYAVPYSTGWGGTFPTGYGSTSASTISPKAGIYNVSFNSTTLAYTFSPGINPIKVVSLEGTAVTGGVQTLISIDGMNYSQESVTFLNAGTGHFVEKPSDINPLGPYENWSNSDFPSGIANSGGADIAVKAGIYNVSFNKSNGIYAFAPTIISIIGDFNGWAGDIDFTTIDNIIFTRTNYTFSAGGGLKFRDNHNWKHNIGSPANPSSFPIGIAADMDGGPNINYTAGTYDITFNRNTLEYNFFKHSAYNDQISVAEGGTATSLVSNAVSVLSNDAFGANLIAKLVSNVTNGSLTLNSDGTFSYVHDGSETLTDSFSYKANNGVSDSNLAMVNITIMPVNDNVPTDILLSNAIIIENLNNSIIGNLSSVDIDTNNVFTYELVSGNGDTGNSNFVIVNGNQLKNLVSFDFETQPSYSIRIKVSDGGGHTFEKSFAINVTNINDIGITYSAIDSYCFGSISINTVTNTTGVLKYSWTASNGGDVQPTEQNTASITNLPNGKYTITIMDDYFPYTQSFNTATLPQYQNTSVCYVTSDDIDTTKNRIFINNQGNYNVGSYEILKEYSVDNYIYLGTMTSSETSFLDTSSKNTSKTYRYKVRAIDNCGNTSQDSSPHKTIMLSTGVAIGNSVNLSWNNYEGIDIPIYNIYRKINQGEFEFLDYVTPDTNNNYNDNTANILTNNYEYYVSVDGISPCVTSAVGKIKVATSSIKSNVLKLGTNLSVETNVLSTEIILFPNPSSSKVVLKMPASLKLNGIEIYNTSGQLIITFKEKEFSVEFLSTGTYLIKIVTDQGTAIKNFIKE